MLLLDRLVKAAKVGAASPLFSLSASQRVWGLKLWLPSLPQMGLKGESCAAFLASISLPWGVLGGGGFQLAVAARGAPQWAGVLQLWAEQPCSAVHACLCLCGSFRWDCCPKIVDDFISFLHSWVFALALTRAWFKGGTKMIWASWVCNCLLQSKVDLVEEQQAKFHHTFSSYWFSCIASITTNPEGLSQMTPLVLKQRPTQEANLGKMFVGGLMNLDQCLPQTQPCYPLVQPWSRLARG